MEKITSLNIVEIYNKIHETMLKNKDYLVELDAKTGDGDLGISMCQGFAGVCKELATLDPVQLEPAKIIMKAALAINEYSPSSLGTILSIAMMNGAKAIKGVKEIGVAEWLDFIEAAMEGIMNKTGSKRGEKTILDSLGFACDSLNESVKASLTLREAAEAAANAATEGMLATKEMMAVHGRAAYYQEKTIGNIDGGATVGMLIFKTINSYLDQIIYN
ncbi:dihydroxyacetone kinase subunit L [Vallitalea maricola]|uniref:Dihydroxyacetone kinase subunit L n=1 Tax=Vallitalea maricola TaxID=3074433 RepID=A0ACB5UQT1_9FIRM|nr:dihydroxyacetone kinase subunit L [Vallitalea sp. AN17-2]